MEFFNILNHVIGFILHLYGSLDLPRKFVQDIIDYIIDFNKKTYLPSIERDILAILREENISDNAVRRIHECFKEHADIFDAVDTESKRFNILRDNKGFIDANEFYIGRAFRHAYVENNDILVPEYMYGAHIPLQDSLKVFLEIPGMFHKIMNYMKKLSKPSEIITNCLQGKLWKDNYAQKWVNEIVMPLYVFYDDLEVGNALGSHAGKNKFGATYVSIACLPPSIASKLNSIIFSSLFYTSDKKKSNNQQVFSVLIEELNNLREKGINITVDGETINVKFQAILILGDNLGLNGILGFVESFKANHYCRICKASSEECMRMTEEDPSILRTKMNYSNDVEIADATKTGIKESCTFHNLNDFHVTENVGVDLMHDFFEGVAYYVFDSLLETFILEKKYFTVNQFNSRVQSFNFGAYNMNKPAAIRLDERKNKLIFKCSASEMISLISFLGVIIGDLIPKSETRWKLYIHLCAVFDIVMSPRFVPAYAELLRDAIKNLNRLYIQFYKYLKPKFHLMTHYPRILLNNGPIVKFWCMRFEAFHQYIKSNADSSSNNMNLIKTVTIKQALKLCELAHTLTLHENVEIVLGNIIETVNRKDYFDDKQKNEEYVQYEKIELDNIVYEVGSFIALNVKKIEKDFGKILNIVYLNNEIYFELSVFEEVTFDEHINAYIIEKVNQTRFINYKKLPIVAPVMHVVKNDDHLLVSKYIL